MKVEILYPELCCLYGDKGNTLFLRRCLPEAEFITTTLNDTPAFLSGEVDLCYLASMSEQSQELILSRLMPYKEAILSMMREGKCLFLLTGPAMELLGSYIQREDGSRVEALGAYDIYSVRQAPNRFNTLVRADFRGTTLLGYTSRFAHTFGITEDIALAKTDIGCGCCEGSVWEASVTAMWWPAICWARCWCSTPISPAGCWSGWAAPAIPCPLKTICAALTSSS